MKHLPVPSVNNTLSMREHTYVYAYNTADTTLKFTISYSSASTLKLTTVTVAALTSFLLLITSV